MTNKGKIILLVELVFKMVFVYSENDNTNKTISNSWIMWGKPFGCEDGFVAVNYQNEKPLKGACVPISYDANRSPNPDAVTNVYVSFNYQKLVEVNEVDKIITVETKISIIWEDHRIKTTQKDNNSYIKLAPDVILPKVWIPMAFHTSNVKMVRQILDPFLYTELRLFLNNRISSNSTALNLTVEHRTTLYCDFELKQFPFDTQKCQVHSVTRDPDRLQVWLYDPQNQSLHSTKSYETAGFTVLVCFSNFTNGVGFDVELKRLVLPYIFQYYLPCISIVLVSFISFIVPLSSLPGRIGLIVTQFLTLTNIFIHQIVSFLYSYQIYWGYNKMGNFNSI